MKVSNCFKKTGNSLPRIYRGIKKGKRFSFAMAGAEFAVGIISAKNKDVLNTGLAGMLSCFFARAGKNFSDMQKMIEPQFRQIVERAKRIKLSSKLSK